MFGEQSMAVNNGNDYIVESDKRVYTVDEIQDILGISRATAYALLKKNVFHYVRLKGRIRISKKSFDAWLDGLGEA